LGYMNYPEYLGLDVSETSVRLCARKYEADPSKSFLLYKPGTLFNRGFLRADMTVCLDVLYHVTDDEDYRATLRDLFSPEPAVVVLYTRLTDGTEARVVPTIRDRDVLGSLAEFRDYEVSEIVPQRYRELSSADFIVLRRVAGKEAGG